MGLVVVPSVSDGVLNLPSQREGATQERVSEMGRKGFLCVSVVKTRRTGVQNVYNVPATTGCIS